MASKLLLPAAETILCDTSFVSAVERGQATSWPRETVARLEAAEKAISVITLAELRAGHLEAGWQPPRRDRAETRISAYLHVPLDMAIVNEWARLKALCRSNGTTTPHNDLWIAATANTRGWPLASCDAHFDSIPVIEHIKLGSARAEPATRRTR